MTFGHTKQLLAARTIKGCQRGSCYRRWAIVPTGAVNEDLEKNWKICSSSFHICFLSHSSSSPTAKDSNDTTKLSNYHKCFIMFYREMFGCSGLHCFLFTGAASLPQLWLGSPASGFKRLAAKQAVGRDHQNTLWLLPPATVMVSEMIPAFSRLILAMFGSRTTPFNLKIYSLACPHANLPWREHHSFSAPCSAPSTCCQCRPRQPGTKHQCHPWRKYRHTDGSPRHNREWRSASLRLWQSRASCCSSERCSRAGRLGTGI